MKKCIKVLAAAIIGFAAVACSSAEKMAEMAENVRVECNPAVLEAVAGNIDAALTVTYPEGYFHPKAILEVTPVLVYEGGEQAAAKLMYQGEKVPVSMRFSNTMVDAVMDRFGKDVLMMKADDRHFEITAVVSVSPQFFGWVFGLGNKVEILGPEDVRKKMKHALEEISVKYQNS